MNGTRDWRRGLYLLTPEEPDTARLIKRVAEVIAHVALLQYRSKHASATQRREQALALRMLCEAASVPLVVNDDAQLAREIAAGGVHLGEDDMTLLAAREILGDDAIIGVSCYDDIQTARDAVASGADYVAFGAFFPSSTKPQQQRRASTALLEATEALGVPRVAIGGITPDNAGMLVDAGADLVAVIAGVFDAPDPARAARDIANRFG